MKPRDVSVSVVQMGDDQYVNVTLRLPNARFLEKENMPTATGGFDPDRFRVKESSRRRRQKHIQRIIEQMEISDDE